MLGDLSGRLADLPEDQRQAVARGAAYAALHGPSSEASFITPEARRYARKFGLNISTDTNTVQVLRRVIIGTWSYGFIYAGNLAYMSMLAMFPFFLLGAAGVTAIGEPAEQEAIIRNATATLPLVVREVVEPVAISAVHARTGWLLWAGAIVGLWTTSSLVETIRDILRKAYGTPHMMAVWKTRLLSTGIIMLLVVLMMASLLAQVVIGAVQEAIQAFMPGLANLTEDLSITRFIAATGLLIALYLLFVLLTPQRYRGRRYPKWPGAAFVALWWMSVSFVLPIVLREFFSYDLTYGSLAGIVVTLLFFYLIGLGIVVGAELNAALAEPPRQDENDEDSRFSDSDSASSKEARQAAKMLEQQKESAI